jgi:SAM-dependent methyltransferase
MGSVEKEELKEHILTHGCCPAEENLNIYEKYFAHAPRYLFRAVDKKYHIAQKILCDVGCGYGMNLFHCATGSYGIEVDGLRVKFANSLGLNVFQRDIINDNVSDLPKVEVVWCSAVLEHVSSPHIFLKKLYILLRQDSLLILYVPTIPTLPWLQRIPGLGRYVSGYKAQDHINAFVPSTLRFTCEQAGFRTIEISPFYPGPLRFLDHFPVFNRITGRCVYIGQKIEKDNEKPC